MKKLNLLLSLILFSSTFSFGLSECCPEPWCPQIYIAASAGPSFHNDTKTSAISVDEEIGVMGSASIGYILQRWRIELEGSIRYYSNDDMVINGNKVNSSGHLTEKALMLNGLYNIPLDFRFEMPATVYMGGGLGICRSVLGLPGNSSGSTLFAWQLIAGVACDLTDYWAITLGYRFFSTAKPTYNNNKVSEIPYSNNIDLGLRLTF